MNRTAPHSPRAETEAAQAALARAQLAEALWALPILADPEVPVALRVPDSVWATCKFHGDTPPLFVLGRRLFVRTADLRSWLDAKAAQGKPGSKRLRAIRGDVQTAEVGGA